MKTLTIQPLPVGWALSISGVPNDTLFHSGGAAEASARRLATRLAARGEAARLVIRLRDGSVAGRFLFPPTLAREEHDDLLRAA